jgi:hypothetical protein
LGWYTTVEDKSTEFLCILLLIPLTLVCTAAVYGPQLDHAVSTTRRKTKLLHISARDQLKWIVGYPIDAHVMSAEFADEAVPVEGVEDE